MTSDQDTTTMTSAEKDTLIHDLRKQNDAKDDKIRQLEALIR